MKTRILLSLLFIPLNLLAQRGGTAELYMWTNGFSPTTEVNFYLDASGPVWDEDTLLTTEEALLHNLLNIPDDWEEIEVRHGDDWDSGWDHITSNTIPERPNYGWGLYEVSTSESGSYFYIDYRDDRWPDYDLPVNGSATDLWLRYYKSTDEFKYSSDGSSGWTTISDGEYLTIWGIKQKGDPSVGAFENYWTNCLNMTYNSSGNPRIVWGSHPSFSPITGYKIYRANNDYGDPEPDPGDFSLLATVNSSTFDYTDTDVRLSETEDDICWYGVRAYYTHPKTQVTIYSDTTNIVHTEEVEFYKSVGEKGKFFYLSSPKLHQNFPNPFNPTTTISFDLPRESNVQLQIYDIQGKVISILLNKKMTEGTHSVSFNSNGLPSGVYFYKLQTKEFTDIKRMLLLK